MEDFIKHCLACQDSAKAHKPVVVPHSAIPRPTEVWHKLGLDICGPFATASRHQRFITTVIDYASGYPEVLLSEDITSGKLITWKWNMALDTHDRMRSGREDDEFILKFMKDARLLKIGPPHETNMTVSCLNNN